MIVKQLKSTRPDPSIVIPQDILYNIQDIVDIHKDEVGWIGEVERDEENNVYRVTNITLPKQDVHSTTTEITSEGIEQIMDEEADTFDISKWRYWGHSHVDMGVFASGQDEKQMQEFTNSCKWFIGTIHNKQGDIYGYIVDKDRGLFFYEVDVVIERPESYEPMRDWDKLSKERVKKLVSTYSYGGYKSRYGQKGSTNSRVKEKDIWDMTRDELDEYYGLGSYDRDYNRYPSSNGAKTHAELMSMEDDEYEQYCDGMALLGCFPYQDDAVIDDSLPLLIDAFGSSTLNSLVSEFPENQGFAYINHGNVLIEVVDADGKMYDTVAYLYHGHILSEDDLLELESMADNGTYLVAYNQDWINVQPLLGLLDRKDEEYFSILELCDKLEDSDDKDSVIKKLDAGAIENTEKKEESKEKES